MNASCSISNVFEMLIVSCFRFSESRLGVLEMELVFKKKFWQSFAGAVWKFRIPALQHGCLRWLY